MELKQHITDERTGFSYTLCGDYYLPDLKLPEEKAYDLGRFRQSNAPAFAEGPHGPADGPADRRTPFLSTAGKEIIINRGSSPIALPVNASAPFLRRSRRYPAADGKKPPDA